MYHVQQAPEDVNFHLFHLFIATPEKVYLDDDVISIKAPGREGWFEVLVNHSSFMTILKEGKVSIKDKYNNTRDIEISGGYFEISKNQAYLLADTAAESGS